MVVSKCREWEKNEERNAHLITIYWKCVLLSHWHRRFNLHCTCKIPWTPHFVCRADRRYIHVARCSSRVQVHLCRSKFTLAAAGWCMQSAGFWGHYIQSRYKMMCNFGMICAAPVYLVSTFCLRIGMVAHSAHNIIIMCTRVRKLRAHINALAHEHTHTHS